jgi:hypothetical protein
MEASMFKSVMRGVLIALFGVVLCAATPSLSHAISYNLTSNHCTVPAECGAPGTIFGTVTLTQNGTTVDVTVDLNNPPYVYAQTGSVDFALFKFNATGVVLADITVDQTVAGQTLAAATGTFNGDGTGNFSWGIFCTTCGNGIQTFSNDLVFHVANATIADLTVPNNLGNLFVADIGCATSTGGFCTQGATGPIDATPGPIVGAGIPGLIAACGLLIGFARRRRKQLA